SKLRPLVCFVFPLLPLGLSIRLGRKVTILNSVILSVYGRVVGRPTLAANGFGIGEGGDFKAQMFQFCTSVHKKAMIAKCHVKRINYLILLYLIK
ncbi:MAG: hypothetical protein QM535_19210, partial [Limnohabitans sp.]|nr:hypothetical protein [Limnohabitans sp.]